MSVRDLGPGGPHDDNWFKKAQEKMSGAAEKAQKKMSSAVEKAQQKMNTAAKSTQTKMSDAAERAKEKLRNILNEVMSTMPNWGGVFDRNDNDQTTEVHTTSSHLRSMPKEEEHELQKQDSEGKSIRTMIEEVVRRSQTLKHEKKAAAQHPHLPIGTDLQSVQDQAANEKEVQELIQEMSRSLFETEELSDAVFGIQNFEALEDHAVTFQQARDNFDALTEKWEQLPAYIKKERKEEQILNEKMENTLKSFGLRLAAQRSKLELSAPYADPETLRLLLQADQILPKEEERLNQAGPESKAAHVISKLQRQKEEVLQTVVDTAIEKYLASYDQMLTHQSKLSSKDRQQLQLNHDSLKKEVIKNITNILTDFRREGVHVEMSTVQKLVRNASEEIHTQFDAMEKEHRHFLQQGLRSLTQVRGKNSAIIETGRLLQQFNISNLPDVGVGKELKTLAESIRTKENELAEALLRAEKKGLKAELANPHSEVNQMKAGQEEALFDFAKQYIEHAGVIHQQLEKLVTQQARGRSMIGTVRSYLEKELHNITNDTELIQKTLFKIYKTTS